MRWIVAGLVTLALGLFAIVWWQGRAGPTGYLYAATSAEGEAGYCLAVAERISEITWGQGDPRLEAHLDEQVAFWRPRVGQSGGAGRVALARDSSAPGVNEGAHLHLAVQDCALRAVSFYGHRFPSFE
ncbi:MAG: hypothetical protein U1E69_11070 [Tabrizicola sp.]|uniref:hypothetical protein n=1 Tax=Tabrizicola sp. TaxID=2005166 RepID=UPI002ABAE4E3|nr:hypothetical protein [Tabrizicola sp.]MDZ4087330.1 hypothetical protein [Tabrizicola sp.]